METQYSSLAELRSQLTDDDPDERANAYGAVMQEDVQPSQVLGTNPDQPAVQSLVEAGIIPEKSSEGGRPAAERDEEVVEILKEIRDAVQNDGGTA